LALYTPKEGNIVHLDKSGSTVFYSTDCSISIVNLADRCARSLEVYFEARQPFGSQGANAAIQCGWSQAEDWSHIRALPQHIQELACQDKLRVIIVLDDAQLLPIHVLEQLHFLMNFEKNSKPWLS